MSVADIWKLINDGGVIGFLILVLVGGYQKWWVFGWLYSDLLDDRNRWRSIAEAELDTAERAATRALDLAKRKRGPVKSP